MRWYLLLIGFAACGDSSGSATDAGGDGKNPDAAASPLDGVGSVELVQGGYMFTEGPQWREMQGVLLFTDIPASTIFQYTPGGGAPTVFRMPSGESNGLAIDNNGSVISAQHNNHQIARDGVEIVSIFENNRLNSPNDVIVDGDGTIYFTDPPYGLPDGVTAQPFNGVFRIAPNNQVTAEYRGAMTERPNGIGLSLDSKTLYVDDTVDGKVWGFPIDANGALGTRSVVATTSGSPDGLAIDAAGNLFVATMAGIEVFSPSGTKWGTIDVPMQPSNCAFGGADHKTLFITARTALYKVTLAHPGMPMR
ncbi:MAG TPA: SMP-30/gluconolactonase/LRE family protein [Kofleriaceae bacterium]